MPSRRAILLSLPPAVVGLLAFGARAVRASGSGLRAQLEPRRDAGREPLEVVVPPPVDPNPVDPAPQRILVIGDSMIYNLLPTLADYCLENGHYLHPGIWWGSTSMGWAAGRKLDELTIRHQPTFVLVVLGSSEVLSKVIHTIAPPAIHKLLTRVAPRKLAWIGPPNWCPDTGINEVLEREVPKGQFFRSADLTLEREADGIHPTRKGGAVWAGHIIRWLANDSTVRIRLEPPTRVAQVPSATCYGAAWETKKKD